jgi:hypothetical protein
MTVRLQIIAKRAIALGATSIPETAAPVAARPAAAAKSLHAGVLRPRPIRLCISPAASFCPALAVSLVGRLPCLRGNPWLDPASGAGFRFLRLCPLPSLACCLPRPLLCAPLPRPTCPLQLPPSSLHAVASPHATTQRLQDACLLIVFCVSLLIGAPALSSLLSPSGIAGNPSGPLPMPSSLPVSPPKTLSLSPASLSTFLHPSGALSLRPYRHVCRSSSLPVDPAPSLPLSSTCLAPSLCPLLLPAAVLPLSLSSLCLCVCPLSFVPLRPPYPSPLSGCLLLAPAPLALPLCGLTVLVFCAAPLSLSLSPNSCPPSPNLP